MQIATKSRDYHNDDALFRVSSAQKMLFIRTSSRGLRDYGVTGAYLIGSVTAASPKTFLSQLTRVAFSACAAVWQRVCSSCE